MTSEDTQPEVQPQPGTQPQSAKLRIKDIRNITVADTPHAQAVARAVRVLGKGNDAAGAAELGQRTGRGLWAVYRWLRGNAHPREGACRELSTILGEKIEPFLHPRPVRKK